MASSHLEEEEYAPARTQVQGTLAYSVPYGYEERDVNTQALFRWLFGLTVVTAIIHVVLWGAFQLLVAREEARDRLPSALFSQQVVPPEPRVLPNPIDDNSRPLDPQIGPMEYYFIERDAEDAALAEIGLWDTKTNQAVIPEDILNKVATQPDTTAAPTAAAEFPAPLIRPMPSDASGGTVYQNQLR